MLQFPLVKGNKGIKHKWKGNFPFPNPVSCNNVVRSAGKLVQSDKNHPEAYGGLKAVEWHTIVGAHKIQPVHLL